VCCAGPADFSLPLLSLQALFEFVEKEAKFSKDLKMLIEHFCDNPRASRFFKQNEQK